MSRAWMHNGWRTVVVAGAAVALTAAPLLGQAKSGKAGARAPRNAPSGDAAGAGGLASLSDDDVLSELASRQMQGLLDFAFKANNVPESQRATMLAIPAINRLGDTQNPPPPHERAQLIQRIAEGSDQVVRAIDDPAKLMEHSTTLIKFGVEPEVNLIEYWGESPKVQKRLAPIIGTVMKMLDKAVERGTAQRTKLEEQLNDGRNRKVEEEWTKVDQLVSTAEYTRAMVTYNEALAIPPDAKGLDKRKQECTAAIEFLQAYDNGESGIQAAIRNRLGKLNMAMREWGPANDMFESIVAGQVNDKQKIQPAPSAYEQYEARYFSVVCELMQGDIARAKKGVEEVVSWQKENVKDAEVLKQLDAAADLLRYRIATRERDRAKDPAAKKAAEDRAMNVLLGLNEKQPALRPIIAEQLIEQMGEKVDVKKADLLILQALLSRGVQAREAIDDPANPDPERVKEVEQAVAAGREILIRKDPKIVAPMVQNAAIEIPQLLQRIGRKVDAANAYLDYIEQKRGTNPKIDQAAFERAGSLLDPLVRAGEDKNDPALAKAWERLLPLAVNRYGRKDYAFDLGMRLRAKQQPREAIKYFDMVPKDDRRRASATYYKMIALMDLLYVAGPDGKPLLKPEERPAIQKQAEAAADQVQRDEQAASKSAKDEKEKAYHRGRLAVVTLTRVDLAARSNPPDWQKILTILEGYEAQSAGLDNESSLNKQANERRITALMNLKRFNEAAELLVVQLEKEPGGRAADKVLGISRKLREDFDRARAEGNEAAAKDIIGNLANLSGFLVKWAGAHKDPEVQKSLYVYKRYDADTQRLYGATLEGADKQAQLQKAMAAFQALRQPNEVAAYKATIEARKKENPKDKTDPNEPDPAVTLGIALTTYDLEDWKTAATELKKLSFARKLGSRQRVEIDERTGEARIAPNEQYWEATYKYYEAVRRWAKADPENQDAQKELPVVKDMLRRDYVAGPDDVGGTKWREAFEALRKELIPDFDLDALRQQQREQSTPTPGEDAPPAETQPAEPVARGANR